MVPVYESKMLHHYDHRWATYGDGPTRTATEEEKNNPNFVVQPRYWIGESEMSKRLNGRWDKTWLLGFRKICRATDERTLINFAYPAFGLGDSGNLLFPTRGNPGELVGALTSLVMDYTLRQKLGGTNLNFFQFEQLAVVPPTLHCADTPWDQQSRIADWFNVRIAELSFTDNAMKSFACEIGETGAPFKWDSSRRMKIRAELDAAFFHLYGIARDEADYILDTFPILRGKDNAEYGEYRTKRIVLEIFDAMQHAIDTGEPYQTSLEPPPGHGPRHEILEVAP